MAVRRVTLAQVKTLKGKTSKEELKKLRNHEINEAALADPNSAIPTDKELAEFRRVGIKNRSRRRKK